MSGCRKSAKPRFSRTEVVRVVRVGLVVDMVVMSWWDSCGLV